MAETKKGKQNSRKLTEALRKLGPEELAAKLAELKDQLMHDRFRHATATLENTASLATTRRQIARIETVIRQKQQGAK